MPPAAKKDDQTSTAPTPVKVTHYKHLCAECGVDREIAPDTSSFTCEHGMWQSEDGTWSKTG